MPDTYGPFSGAAWQQSGWYRDHGWREPSGVQGAPQASVASGDLGWSSNGLTSSIALGRAHVRGAAYERTSTAWTYTHPANTNANPRIDRIVLRRDLAAGTVTPQVLQGTPAASPTPVALTQVEDGVWELALFQVTVPANSGTTLTAVEERRWISADGVLDTGWVNTPAPGGILSVGANGSKYRVKGGWCSLRAQYAVAGTASIPNGQGFFVLPAEAWPTFAIVGPLSIAYGGTAGGQVFETVISTGGLLTINGRGLTTDGYQLLATWPVG